MINPSPITIHTPEFLQNLRQSGRILTATLQALHSKIAPGVTGTDLETLAQDLIKEANATPAFQGFQGFPFALCISINDEIVHAFPDDRPLQPGDLITIDCGVNFQTAITDAAFSIIVSGKSNPPAQNLIHATESALKKAINFIKPGVTLHQIGSLINKEITSKNCSVVKDLCGHGVGHQVHEHPFIFNFQNPDIPDEEIKAGQIIAIEPIASLGNGTMTTLKNGWTIVTSDHTLASQSEATLFVTASGVEIIASLPS